MNLRPTRAKWFETYVPRHQTVRATEVLAATGVVQLELDLRQDEQRTNIDRLRFFIEAFDALAASHSEDLPTGVSHPTALIGDSTHIANQALHHLRIWSAQVDYVQEHLAQLQVEHEHLVLLTECLEGMPSAGLEMEGVFRETQFLCKCLFACPRNHQDAHAPSPELPPELPPDFPPELQSVVTRVSRGPRHNFLYFAGSPEQRELIGKLVVEGGCEQVGIPTWLSGNHDQQRLQLLAQQRQSTQEIAAQNATLQALRRDEQIAKARANIDTLRWYLQHAAGSLTEKPLCHVTGWTTCHDPQQLQGALHKADIQAMVRFPRPPADIVAPVALLDAWWSRPFQPLLQMWGTPDGTQVDPSGLLAVVAPLLFGYMFPDIGHGFVLVLVAILFSRRWPQIRFLLPCGLSAMAFGLLFGDVFGFDDLAPALWLKPLDHPLTVLAVPLVFGAGLMSLGLVFAGVEAAWRGRLREWLWMDAAVLVMYAASLVGLFLPQVFAIAGLAVVQYFVGSLLLAQEGRLNALSRALGELLLSAFELVMNTFSFMRVGAFALAHAALSLAVMSLAASLENPIAFSLALIVGNLFSIVLEGLLALVQTTRLVLFEFFIHFLHEEGRLFRPAHRPPGA